MNRVASLVQKISCKIVLGISMVIVGFLFIQLFFTDVKINIDEKAIFSYLDSWWKYIIAIFLLLGGTFIVNRYCKGIFNSHFIKVITCIYAVLMLCFVIITKMEPRADQQLVLQVADQFAAGDYSAWAKGAYGDLYSNQYGLILILATFSKIWGKYNWLLFQMMNIIFIIIAAIGMKKITFIFFNNEKVSQIVYLMLLFFLPMDLYVTFVYGTLPGLASVVWGTYFVLKSFEKDSIIMGLLSAVLIVSACVLKSNYLIYFLGVLIVIFFYCCKKKSKASLCVIISLLVLYSIAGHLINSCINNKVGNREQRGIPSIAWVAMGLQDTGEKGPGWYNSYTKEVYWDNNCNNELTKIEAQKEVVKSLKYLSADINGGIKFFYKKIASEWNEPTFESLWINNKLRNRNQDIPKWVQNFFDGQNILSELYVEAYRIILFLLWMGILIFLYLERKTDNIMNLLWLIIFIGGFLFHLFWEAKGQYTLIYVWLCIPYGVKGYYSLFNSINTDLLYHKRKG